MPLKNILNRVYQNEIHDRNSDLPVRDDLNITSAYLHVIGDALSSMGVIIAVGIEHTAIQFEHKSCYQAASICNHIQV